MSDVISRQVAISAICSACGKIDCDKMDKCEKLQLPPANCSEFPNSSDTISRQQAIEALKNDMASLDHIIKGMSANDVRLDAYVSQRNQVNYDIYTINNLPPAQPEQLGTNLAEVGTDCISRQAAINALTEYGNGRAVFISVGEAVIRIEQLPPSQPKLLQPWEVLAVQAVLSQPEIIRCKDCKHFKQVLAPNDNDGLCGHWHSKCDARTSQEGYCSHAERREEME